MKHLIYSPTCIPLAILINLQTNMYSWNTSNLQKMDQVTESRQIVI